MDYKFINPEYLNSVSEGNPEIVIEIIELFKTQREEIYREMLSHLAEKDYKSLGFLAHKAKSSVSIMGMNNLAIMLKNFELQSKDGIDSSNYESYIERFRYETGEAVKELEDFIDKELKIK
jgi:hypothetical protein